MGLGRIGLAVAKRFSGFEIGKIIYTATKAKPEAGHLEHVTFEKLLADSDVIVITCAFNEQTKEIFNKDAFKKMKNTAFIINNARGGIIQQDDLVEALKQGEIAGKCSILSFRHIFFFNFELFNIGAGLDVMTPEPIAPNHELVKMPNVVLTPHIGTSTRETRLEMIHLVVDNILAGLQDKPMPTRLC